jgi:hypothetical protein
MQDSSEYKKVFDLAKTLGAMGINIITGGGQVLWKLPTPG